MNAAAPYLRAAKRRHADPEALITTARSELSTRQLAQLVSTLHEHHDFKLPKRDRDRLIDDLDTGDMSTIRIAKLLGCNRRTVARRLEQRPGVTDRTDKRSECDNTGSCDKWVANHPPILSWDATSGANLTAEKYRALVSMLGVGL